MDLDKLVPQVILGQDDWLIYGRTAEGILVWVSIETDYHWLDTPHQGGQQLPYDTFRDDYYGTAAWREDNQWMHDRVTDHKADYYWRECDTDPVSGEYLGWPPDRDEDFIASSNARYLPVKV